MHAYTSEMSGVSKARLVAVEGNIGAGKSTLLAAMSQWYRGSAEILPEPIDEWRREGGGTAQSPLASFYRRPDMHAMSFQALVMSTKMRELDASMRAHGGTGLYVCERDPYDTDVFPRLNVDEGLFDETHVAVLQHLAGTFAGIGRLPALSGSIYLRAPPDLCAARIVSRGRAEEVAESGGLSAMRVARLHRLHEAKFGEAGALWARGAVLVLDASVPVGEHRASIDAFLARVAPP